MEILAGAIEINGSAARIGENVVSCGWWDGLINTGSSRYMGKQRHDYYKVDGIDSSTMPYGSGHIEPTSDPVVGLSLNLPDGFYLTNQGFIQREFKC